MLALVLLATSLAATPDECREAYAAVNYRDAAQACEAVLSTASPAELPGLYRLAALSRAALGDSERAAALFSSLLALDPDVQLDAAISPKLRAPFERARARRGTTKAELRLTPAAVTPEGAVSLSVEVADGPSRPIVAIIGHAAGAPVRVPREDPTRVSLIVQGGGPASVRVGGYDRFGGELALAMLEVRAPAEAPRRLSWKPWAVAAGVVLAGAVASAVSSTLLFDQAKSQRFASDAATKLELSHATALGADIGFGVGGALGVVTLVLLLVGTAS